MKKAVVVYYSATGNTQMIAEAIFDALNVEGVESSLNYVSDINVSDVSDADLFFLGSPAMGVEEIEEYEFRPFFDDLKPFLASKSVFLFGSYDWGDEEWMTTWTQELEEVGAVFEGKFVVNMTPEPEFLESVKETIAEFLK